MLQNGSFDPDKFLAALPRYDFCPATTEKPFDATCLKYVKLKTYNGFTESERKHTACYIRWLRACGVLQVPKMCSVCGSLKKVRFHSENYYALNRSPALCDGCHFCIHIRFRRPATWVNRVAKFNLPSEHWVNYLPAFNFDLAKYLRGRAKDHDIRCDHYSKIITRSRF